ncbi:MAG: hypothetical protein WDN50_02890 [Bradyrhizobium sp.]
MPAPPAPRAYTAGTARMRDEIVKNVDNNSSITMERLGIELENFLDKETIFVTDCESGRIMDSVMNFGGTYKAFYIHHGQYPRLGAGRRHGRATRPAQSPGGLRDGRRQRDVRRPATAVEPGALQGADHQSLSSTTAATTTSATGSGVLPGRSSSIPARI